MSVGCRLSSADCRIVGCHRRCLLLVPVCPVSVVGGWLLIICVGCFFLCWFPALLMYIYCIFSQASKHLHLYILPLPCVFLPLSHTLCVYRGRVDRRREKGQSVPVFTLIRRSPNIHWIHRAERGPCLFGGGGGGLLGVAGLSPMATLKGSLWKKGLRHWSDKLGKFWVIVYHCYIFFFY